MPDVNDMDLLRDYAQSGSEGAFTELVRRHINLVYSAALRHVGTAAQAEEITQAVFIILARKAGGLRPNTILEGWLYETTRLTALSFLRGERRRQFREQEAYMQSTLQEEADDSVWNQMAPLLDEAMSHLGTRDRDAVMLRFFKDKSVREVASALQVSEAAAQRRVLRAMEKLRVFFVKRGMNSSSALIAGAISAHSIQTAPAALAKSVTAVAVAKGAAASASTLTLIQGALKVMAWTKAKIIVVTCASVLLAAGTVTVVVREMQHGRANPAATSSDSEVMQGTWSGREIGAGGKGSSTFVLQGITLEYHGANPQEWYKGNFSLKEDTNPKQFVVVITDCPAPNYVGKTSYAIYKIEGNTLTISGNQPGDPAVPTRFNAPGTRTMVFKK